MTNWNRIVAAAAVLALLSAPALAHVNLQTPNGGERVESGGQYLIVWNVHIQHSTIGWHLHYSVDGGAFQPIVMDLPAGDITAGSIHTYLWNVPGIDSTDVRIRVTQNNQTGTDWTDTSSQAFSVTSSLMPDVATVSATAGGAQNLTVDFGAAFAGNFYAVIGSLSGAQPGVPIGNTILPVNPDVYFTFTVDNPNTAPLLGSSGTLDSSGTAVATFVLPANALPPQAAGIVIFHAALVLNGAANGLGEISNPTTVTLAP